MSPGNILRTALERGLGTDDFTLKYPISGENRSAYILCNLDDESSNEAVVFYQLTGTDTIRMNILDQNDQGEWESVYDMAGAGDDIYTVDLATISTLDRNDLIISSDLPTQHQAVVEAVRSGVLTEAQVDEHVRRVLDWKMRLGLLTYDP